MGRTCIRPRRLVSLVKVHKREGRAGGEAGRRDGWDRVGAGGWGREVRKDRDRVDHKGRAGDVARGRRRGRERRMRKAVRGHRWRMEGLGLNRPGHEGETSSLLERWPGKCKSCR